MTNITTIPMVSVDKLAVAKVTVDTAGLLQSEEFIFIDGTTEAGWNTNPQSASFAADGNASYATAVTHGDISAAITVADVPPFLSSYLYGYDYSDVTKMLGVGKLNSPYVAIKFRKEKMNGGYVYITLFKCRAFPGNQQIQTKGNSINAQTNGFSLACEYSKYVGNFMNMIDTDDLPAGVTAADVEANWYSDINWYPSAPSLVSIAVSPATKSMAVGVTQVLTVTATFTGSITQDITAICKFGSADTAKATVSAAGIVTGVAAGTANIIALYKGKAVTAAFTITT